MCLSRHLAMLFITSAIASTAAAPLANAAVIFWDGGAASSNNWSNADNWTPSSSGSGTSGDAVPSSGDDIVFYSSSASVARLTSNTVDSGFPVAIGSLTFGNSGTGAVTIGGTSTLTINGKANYDPSVMSSGSSANLGTVGLYVQSGMGAVFISAPIALGGAQQWINNSTNSLTVGSVDTNAKALTIAGAGNITISGAVTDSGGITKNGTGTLTLSSGTSTYSGNTLITNGRGLINTTKSGAGSVTVTSGADNQTATFGGTGTVTGAVTISAPTGTGRINQITAADVGTTGTLTLSTAFTTTLTLGAGATMYWDHNAGNALGTAGATSNGYDVINLSGTLSSLSLSATANTGSKLVLSFASTTDFANSFWNAGRTWDIITSISGTPNAFHSSNISVLVNGSPVGTGNTVTGEGSFTTSYDSGDDAIVLSWSALAAVPTISIASSSSRFLVGANNTNLITGTVTSATGNYPFTSIVNKASMTGALSSISPQTGTATAGGSGVNYTASLDGTGKTAGTSYNFGTTVTDGTTSASSSTLALTAVNQRSFTSGTIALGRFLTGATPTGSQGITSTGTNATTANATLGSFTGTNTNGLTLALSSGSASFAGAASQTATYALGGTATLGALTSASFSSPVTAELGSISNVVVNLTGTAVNQRSFTSGTIALGRFLAGATPAGSQGITSTGTNATTANATLGSFTGTNTQGLTLALSSGSASFTGAASQTATYSLGGTPTAGALTSASFSSPVTAELGSISNVIVNVTGTAVTQRSFTSPASINLGIIHVNSAVSSGASVTSSTNNHASVADATLGTYTGSTINGLNLSGGTHAFVGAASNPSGTYTVTGTAPATGGNIGGTFNLNATDEFGNTLTNAAHVAFAGQVNDYAQPTFAKTGGSGTLTPSGSDPLSSTATAYSLAFGSVAGGSGLYTANLAVTNTQLNAVFQDLLTGSYTIDSGSGNFNLANFSNFSNLAIGGSTASAPSVTFNSAMTADSYTEVLHLTPTSHNTSSDTVLSNILLTLTGTITGAAEFDIASPAAINMNVLKGAGGGTLNTSVTVTNNGSAAGVAALTMGSPDSKLNLTSPSGNIAAGGSGSGNLALNTSEYATNSNTINVSAGGSTPSINVHYTIGAATAYTGAALHDHLTTGTAVTANIVGGNSYGTLSSMESNSLGTEAILIGGAASASTTVSMSWRARNTDEIDGSYTNPPIQDASPLISDVVNVTGTGTDPYIIMVSYDAGLLNVPEATAIANGWIRLMYLNPHADGLNDGTGVNDDQWEFAAVGTGVFNYMGDHTPTLADGLGAFGVDTSGETHYAWAIVDHNSEFAVVPEPASLSLLGMGAMALMRRRRR